MTIGALLGVAAVGLAFAAAAFRGRDVFWGLIAVLGPGYGLLQVISYGLDTTRFVAGSDDMLVLLGGLLLAAVVVLLFALPRRIEERLYDGESLPEWDFERSLVGARRPFMTAARTRDESALDKAHWRRSLIVTAPSPAWASLADRLEESDVDWAERLRSGASADDWASWQAQNDQIGAEWQALRAPMVERRARRARVVRGVTRVGGIAAIGCFVAGSIGLPSAFSSGAPEGRASVLPEPPAGRHVYLAPLGDVPEGELRELAAFYAVRYDLQVEVLPPTPLSISPNPARNQFNAEGVGTLLSLTYPESRDPNNVVIGVLTEDIYLPARPDWAWAFGAAGDRLSIISTYRMRTPIPFLGHRLEQARLRKMVTRYIGFAYFGLPDSPDPQSVLYDNILSLRDLDAMGEDY